MTVLTVVIATTSVGLSTTHRNYHIALDFYTDLANF